MANLESFDRAVALKKEKLLQQEKLEREMYLLSVANKNCKKTYADFEYSVNKQLYSDPRFQFQSDSYDKCQEYLLGILKCYIQYLSTGLRYNRDKDGNVVVLTRYSILELQEAIYKNNQELICLLRARDLNPIKFLEDMIIPEDDEIILPFGEQTVISGNDQELKREKTM